MSSLTVENLTYTVEGKILVDDFSLRIEPGTFVALIGPNGSGKSTLLKLVAGILPLHRLAHSAPVSHAKSIFYLGSHLDSEFPLTCEEVIWMGMIGRDLKESAPLMRSRAESIMHELDCFKLRDRQFSTLSGGEKQRVALVQALFRDRPILFLDESLSLMDLHHQYRIGQVLTRSVAAGKSVVAVAHDFNFLLDFCPHAIVMAKGKKLAEGRTDEVITETLLSRLYPGLRMQMITLPESGRRKLMISP